MAVERDIRGYTLYLHSAGAVDGYTQQVHTEDNGKKCTLHVYSSAGRKGMHPAHPPCIR
jgi:hypothetical protein